MEIILISIAAFITAILTFFSGFGLGTILTPVFVIFFPIDLAIALTGVVHLFNSLFKLVLVGKGADKKILVRFGIPAILAAVLGAWVLLSITDLQPLFSYLLWGKEFEIIPIKLIIAVLLIGFAVIDLIPNFENLRTKPGLMPVGGALSGFFGGLSGHQGALRSAFLVKSGLSKESFIATSVVIATFIDFTRLSVYSTRFLTSGLELNLQIAVFPTLSAIAGAFVGNRLLKKITLQFIQKLVAILLIIISIALGAGWI